jgi:hypothetical protein
MRNSVRVRAPKAIAEALTKTVMNPLEESAGCACPLLSSAGYNGDAGFEGVTKMGQDEASKADNTIRQRQGAEGVTSGCSNPVTAAAPIVGAKPESPSPHDAIAEGKGLNANVDDLPSLRTTSCDNSDEDCKSAESSPEHGVPLTCEAMTFTSKSVLTTKTVFSLSMPHMLKAAPKC